MREGQGEHGVEEQHRDDEKRVVEQRGEAPPEAGARRRAHGLGGGAAVGCLGEGAVLPPEEFASVADFVPERDFAPELECSPAPDFSPAPECSPEPNFSPAPAFSPGACFAAGVGFGTSSCSTGRKSAS